MQHVPGRPKNAHVDHGEISAFGGIASGRITAWADALEATPEAIIRAASVVPPLMDTAKQNGGKKRDRPTAPHLRCIAWTTGDLPEVRAALEQLRAGP